MMNLVQIVFLACIAIDVHYAAAGDGRPQYCKSTFTAGYLIDGDLFLFKNNVYWRFNGIYNGLLLTSADGNKVQQLFPELPVGLYVKAIYQAEKRKVRVFTGKKYFDFIKNGDVYTLDAGFDSNGKDIVTAFAGINNPNAAVMVCNFPGAYCSTYLINKDKYWEFDGKLNADGSFTAVKKEAPVSERFGSIPEKIDGAFLDGKDIIIIKGNEIYRVKTSPTGDISTEGPKSLATEFFPTNC